MSDISSFSPKDELIEELRWDPQQLGFASPEEAETRRKEKWVTKDSRNHSVREYKTLGGGTSRGIYREVRRSENDLSVEDIHTPIVKQLVEGRTIVSFERENDSGVDWSHGENSVIITLDDGSKLSFMGQGYDASSLITYYEVPNA